MHKDEQSIDLYVDKTERMKREVVNNTKDHYNFKFDKVLDMRTSQETVFNDVAKEVCDSALDGYNGTIFAYGQTGSGKTYTITGGVERVEERGIIPRSLHYIFNEIEKRSKTKYTIRISYLEIYNNDGYDLLSKSSNINKLEDLPRVIIRENSDKQLLLYNLTFPEVKNENDALLLLMVGDDNRVVAETPKNDASTRSHCIFMIHIEGVTDELDENGEINQIKTLAKLHIVDLSGSEKATKTELSSLRFDEARNINLSLHFLGQVISSINKKQSHVPYRNTMITMILRDSLGGNCKTRMIATISALKEDLHESISTCYFARSVALVKNTVVKNEIEDPEVVIKKQRNEIEDLKNELKLIKGVDQKNFLDDEDLKDCINSVEKYMNSDKEDDKIKYKDFLMIQECYSIFKRNIKELERKITLNNIDLNSNSNNSVLVCGSCTTNEIKFKSEIQKLNEDIAKLRVLLKSKDEEIKSLLNYYEKMNINKNIANNFSNNNSLFEKIEKEDKNLEKIKDNYLGGKVNFNNENKSQENSISIDSKNINSSMSTNFIDSKLNLSLKTDGKLSMPINLLSEINKVNSMLKKETVENQEKDLTKNIIEDTKLSYEYFKKNYIKTSIHESNLSKLKELFTEGKGLAEQNIKLRKNVDSLNLRLGELKKEFKSMNYDEKNPPPSELRNLEDQIYTDLKNAKDEFLKNCDKMRKSKENIDFLQNTIEQNTSKMAKDFDSWHSIMIKKFEFESKSKLNLKNTFSLNINESNSSFQNQNVTNNFNSFKKNENLVSLNNKFENINVLNTNNSITFNNNSTQQSTNKTMNEINDLVSKAKNIINKSTK